MNNHIIIPIITHKVTYYDILHQNLTFVKNLGVEIMNFVPFFLMLCIV